MVYLYNSKLVTPPTLLSRGPDSFGEGKESGHTPIMYLFVLVQEFHGPIIDHKYRCEAAAWLVCAFFIDVLFMLLRNFTDNDCSCHNLHLHTNLIM